MTIEPTEQHGDKTSGLQYSGEPTERALRYQNALALFKKYEAKTYSNAEEAGWDWVEFIDMYGGEVEKALELMAKEKTNG